MDLGFETVDGQQIIGWANDAYENDEIDEKPKDLSHAIAMLEDIGFITVLLIEGDRVLP